MGQIVGAPACKEAGTRASVEKMFPVLQTAYDDVWEFSNKMLPGSSDSSYTDLATMDFSSETANSSNSSTSTVGAASQLWRELLY